LAVASPEGALSLVMIVFCALQVTILAEMEGLLVTSSSSHYQLFFAISSARLYTSYFS
jgi:hypothetical protein